ncbi:MAG TPA: heavy metal-binding domain-containing protein [Blastocatellia bacterium]|jgi:uncharacterized protein YbjQ (UPF0145 family)|nr:heavy metal-binding domain-containing protein [Blastocatellia bacterium]
MSPDKKITYDLIATTESIPGFKVVKSCGIVLANAACNDRCADPNRINSVNANCARRSALESLRRAAEELGANAVVGLRFDSTPLRSRDTDFCAYGTAVVVEKSSD